MLDLFSALSIVSAEVDGAQAFVGGDIRASEALLAADNPYYAARDHARIDLRFEEVRTRANNPQVVISCTRSIRLGIRNDGSAPLLVCGRAYYANGPKMFGQRLAPGELLKFEAAEPCTFCLDHVEDA